MQPLRERVSDLVSHLGREPYGDTYVNPHVWPFAGAQFEAAGSDRVEHNLGTNPGDEIVEVRVTFLAKTNASPPLMAGLNLNDVVDQVAARGEIGVEEVAPVPVEGESSIATTPATQQLFVDASGGPVTVHLYHHLTYGAREIVVMKDDSGGNAVTIEADVSSSINGAATQVLSSQYDFLRLSPTSTGWRIVGGN